MRIYHAIGKAFKAEKDLSPQEELPSEDISLVTEITAKTVLSISSRFEEGAEIDIEQIQDEVETHLMSQGEYSVARLYIVYREAHKKARLLKQGTTELKKGKRKVVTYRDAEGKSQEKDWSVFVNEFETACSETKTCDSQLLLEELSTYIYENITEEELNRSKVLVARTKIEKSQNIPKLLAYLLLNSVYKEVLNIDHNLSGANFEEIVPKYQQSFVDYLQVGIKHDRLSEILKTYDLEKISSAIVPERDGRFEYMGLQTIYDRYLIHVNGRRIETPQYFWMRVAMGLAINEGSSKNDRAIEFYNMLSTFRFVSSTPTLFNAGTNHPQLSSCYLSTTNDSLEHIYKVIADNAKLSKWAGGLGNDWTNVRSTGAHIKGTNGKSQGVIPFLKVVNDTAIAVNQGGKRKGAVCAYLETWHLEVEEFQELRKNTGDERRRTHDMNTANWIPDLFIKRVLADGIWTLFSPDDTSDLHDLYGQEFEKRYIEYEKMARDGEITNFRRVLASELWRKMLSMVFETGHPWLTFKDPSNIRSPQSHVGVVHSSNLCTEILLNTSEDETAVCNLGSVNLIQHITDDGQLDEKKIKDTVRTAIRMLDNVIDINFYPTIEAKHSNLRHRPIGLGLMGFQDALYRLGVSYASDDAVEFADRSMELISYHAILASTELADERGTYSTYQGSKWSKGLVPIDTIELLEYERGGYLEQNRSSTLDWDFVRKRVKRNGMRNSNVMAIAPTATIANISGISQSIEPTYKHLYVKSNLSGDFIAVNPYLVEDLKELNLWDDEMIDDLKYFDGVISEIERIPAHLKQKYLTAFEIEASWLIECASRRQKWIDMGQSLNLYIAQPNGRMLSEMYLLAWKKGLKTTYYLRSLGATQVEKSTQDINKRGIQPRWMKNKSASSEIEVSRQPQACSIDDPECESCQ